jgi:peptide/nickel transport system permease protein
MPTFWLGLILINFLAVVPKHLNVAGATWLPYLPAGGLANVDQGDDLVNRVYHLVLPVMLLALAQVAQFSRFIRGSMLEVLRHDYVRTAWVKGLPERVVVLRHALPNALLPITLGATLAVPGLLSGVLATEAVFDYPGMGRLFVFAASVGDLPLSVFFVLLVTALIVVGNFLADVLFAFLNPRIRFS